MSDFFKEFAPVSKAEWEAKLISDLKGKDPALLEINDVIEELQLSSCMHREDVVNEDATPGNYPYLRGMNRDDNQWKNGFLITVRDEKEANTKALQALNSGADLLVFKSTESSTNWPVVLEGIELQYIQTQFVVRRMSEYKALKELNLPDEQYIRYNIDFLDQEWSLEDFGVIAKDFKEQQQRFCSVNGFKVQQCGANTWQELAFSLSAAHEYLVRLLDVGFSVDEASACIAFNLGIGANYFNEIAKFRALNLLWSKIVDTYGPEHGCSHNAAITAVTTHVNKSLEDPYTNLLRQTTEAMSAISAGVENIVILPYDHHSVNGSSQLAERMALNISSILKEESYLDKVLDPIGGSYSIEQLTIAIAEKAWSFFQELEKSGGIAQAESLQLLTEKVAHKRALRIDLLNDERRTLIGVNKYPNPDLQAADWKVIENYLGMKALVLENSKKAETV